MKFTYSWLKEYLQTDKNPKEISDKLSEIGLEIEDLTDPIECLKSFKVAEILEVSKHTDADKLNILKVACGQEEYQIVCGAPNVRKGLKSILALSGDVIPLYNEKLKLTKIRGTESQGMLCSEKELLLSDNHEGIKELPDSAKHGELAINYLNCDAVFDGEITSNRPDYLGVQGIARDLSACGYGVMKTVFQPLEVGKDFPKIKRLITLLNVDTCPHFCCTEIYDLKNVQSPEPMYSHLKMCGLTPKSFLIDITNYYCYGKNRPMHAFDIDKLEGDLQIRKAKDGEKFVGLDGKEYTLNSSDCVISDENGIQLLSGIMGSKTSGCDENTKNIMLVCETLDAVSIRKTARRLKIESDSKYRFERGVDPLSDTPNILEARQKIIEICGGTISELKELGTPYKEIRKIKYDLKSFKKLIGIDIEEKTAKEILTNLGFKIEKDFEIIPPSYRQDIINTNDITEELIRIYGYDKVIPVPLPRKEKIEGTLTQTQKNELKIKRILCACGMTETVMWNFVDSKKQELFFDESGVKLQNPILSNMDEMQKTPLINLLEAVSYNQSKSNNDLSIYSVSPIFLSSKTGDQKMITGGIITGNKSDKTWLESNIKYTIFDIKEKVMTLLKEFGLEKSIKILQGDAPKYAHPNQYASLILGKFELGFFGSVHPVILKKFDIKGEVYFFCVNNELLPQKEKTKTKEYLQISELQEVKRDFAFLAEKDFSPCEFIKKIEKLDNLISKVLLFDNFKLEDKKSIGINITLSPFEKTLTQKDLEEIHNKVIELGKSYNLHLRN